LFSLFCIWFHFSQKETISNKQLEAKLIEAGNQLYKLDYNGSLVTSNEVLTQAFKRKNNRLIARAYNLIGLNFAEFSDYKKQFHFIIRLFIMQI